MADTEVSGKADEELVAVAIGEAPDGDAYWDYVTELHKRGTRAIFDVAAALCSDGDARGRKLGLDILAQLGPERRRPFLEEVLLIATPLASDRDWRVRESALSALGHQWDARALPTLIQHRADPDPNVRLAVATSIPNVVGTPPDESAVSTLLELMRDQDSDVRDWATFAIGSLLEIDGDEIRQALRERLTDSDPDAAGEALVGLARRRDPGILQRVRELLVQPTVGDFEVEAAGELADPGLLPELERLARRGPSEAGPHGYVLESAIEGCRSGKPPDR